MNCFVCERPIVGAHVHVGLDEMCATLPDFDALGIARPQPLGLDDILRFPVCAEGDDACMGESSTGWQACDCGLDHGRVEGTPE